MGRGVPKSGRRMTKKFLAQQAGLAYIPKSQSVVQPEVPNRFSINERFEFLGDVCKMIARYEQPAMLLVGPGGVGKSFSVIQSLTAAGLKDATFLANFEVGLRVNTRKTFKVAKGFCTPRGLYKTLYDSKDSILVMDDMDSILKDPTSISLLKGALDSCDKRMITWRSDREDDEYPNSFLFEGAVIFISNMSVHQMDQAVLTRTLCVDLSMTSADKVARIRHIASQPSFMPDFSAAAKQDAVDLIAQLKDKIKQLNLRSLIQTVRIRASAPPAKWKKMADYVLVG